MRLLKTILYYITVAASALFIAFLAIAPFGGHNFILELWRYGLYSNLADASEHILLFRFRQFLGILFSLALLVAVILPFARLQTAQKHRIGVACFLVLAVLLLFPTLNDLIG